MPLEIERKFLLANELWRLHVTTAIHIRQGYVVSDATRTVRVRSAGDRAFITLKGARSGAVRSEFEYPIPLADASVMLDTLCGQPLIEKTRHLVPHTGHTWEIDVFAGANLGLIVAELELAHADEAFAIPVWLGAEVTDDVRYQNGVLQRHPFSRWKA